MNIEDIEGFMPASGLAFLTHLATQKRVLEIGCWKGRTAIGMARTASRVLTIDHFKGDSFAGRANTLQDFLANLEQFPEEARKINVMIGDYFQCLMNLRIAKFDLILYDGDHTFAATEIALTTILPLQRNGQVIVVDDCHAGYPEVIAAVDSVISKHGYLIKETFDNMAVLYHRTHTSPVKDYRDAVKRQAEKDAVALRVKEAETSQANKLQEEELSDYADDPRNAGAKSIEDPLGYEKSRAPENDFQK